MRNILKRLKKSTLLAIELSVALRKLGFRTIHILEMKFSLLAEKWVRAVMLFKMSWVEKNVKNSIS